MSDKIQIKEGCRLDTGHPEAIANPMKHEKFCNPGEKILGYRSTTAFGWVCHPDASDEVKRPNKAKMAATVCCTDKAWKQLQEMGWVNK
mmetsp:Transcript_57719/g.106196  ORF Transcript_57719/g.106196 Transcript_57719/m.106196 type:complete len:89 (-) Transcript_57719:38-304(-)